MNLLAKINTIHYDLLNQVNNILSIKQQSKHVSWSKSENLKLRARQWHCLYPGLNQVVKIKLQHQFPAWNLKAQAVTKSVGKSKKQVNSMGKS